MKTVLQVKGLCLVLNLRYSSKINTQNNPLTPVPAVTSLSRALVFLPLLKSSLLTKIGIVYTQLLQKEKIFPMIPRSE